MKTFSHKVRLSSPFLFTCEHASSTIPKKYGNLGLTREQLQNCKDLDDPGSLELTKVLANHFGASWLATKVSRLVVDANRRPDMKNVDFCDNHHVPLVKTELVVTDGEHDHLVDIPANQNLSIAEENRRYNQYVLPYKNKGLEILDRLFKYHPEVYLIPIHSFYPTYYGHNRTVDIDVLSDESLQVANKIVKQLKRDDGYNVAHNKPWSLGHVDGALFNEVQFKQDHHLVAIDFNNKYLDSKADMKRITGNIIKALESLL